MPFKTVKQYSERGSIKDIQKKVEDSLQEELPPTTFELRIKNLYEHAVANQNQELINSLGLIVMSGPTKDPASILRHREYVNTLKQKKSSNDIPEFMKDLEVMSTNMLQIKYKQAKALVAILREQSFIKIASSNIGKTLRSFRRAD